MNYKMRNLYDFKGLRDVVEWVYDLEDTSKCALAEMANRAKPFFKPIEALKDGVLNLALYMDTVLAFPQHVKLFLIADCCSFKALFI